MTPEEMEFWREVVEYVCGAWCIGALFIGLGIGSISIKNVFNRKEDGK